MKAPKIYLGCLRHSKEGSADGAKQDDQKDVGDRAREARSHDNGKNLTIFSSVEHNELMEGCKLYELKDQSRPS